MKKSSSSFDVEANQKSKIKNLVDVSKKRSSKVISNSPLHSLMTRPAVNTGKD